jgi:hypothetical protein
MMSGPAHTGIYGNMLPITVEVYHAIDFSNGSTLSTGMGAVDVGDPQPYLADPSFAN